MWACRDRAEGAVCLGQICCMCLLVRLQSHDTLYLYDIWLGPAHVTLQNQIQQCSALLDKGIVCTSDVACASLSEIKTCNACDCVWARVAAEGWRVLSSFASQQSEAACQQVSLCRSVCKRNKTLLVAQIKSGGWRACRAVH